MIYKEKIKQIRKENKTKQKELAEYLEISESSYGTYENEIDIFPLKHIIKICEYYQISIDYLFNFTNKKNYPNNIYQVDLNTCGIRLKEFRKEQKVTLNKLGELLNCSYGTIAGYEHGRYLIATPFLYMICKKYNISADYLLSKTDKPKYLSK